MHMREPASKMGVLRQNMVNFHNGQVVSSPVWSGFDSRLEDTNLGRHIMGKMTVM